MSRPIRFLSILFADLACFLIVGALPDGATGQSNNDGVVSWSVVVPEDTPKESELYIAGNIPALGRWRPDEVRLQRNEDGRYTAKLRLPIGTELEYKFTLGSWERVEKSSRGTEIPNRRWKVDGDALIEVEIQSWARPSASWSSTSSGNLLWQHFASRMLNSTRRVTVWLPPALKESNANRFPVVYLLDGQNIFEADRAAFGQEWRADEAAYQLAQTGKSAILVAIDNSPARIDEYTAVPHTLNDSQAGGRADEYLRFLCDELKPWIDHQYPTRPGPEHTTLVGSSLGGLLVLHALSTRGDVFGNGIAMSPSLFWGDDAAVRDANTWSPPSQTKSPMRLWIDMGTREGKSEGSSRRLVDKVLEIESILRSRGGDRLLIRMIIADGAEHNEVAWSQRLPDALRFAVFGEEKSP